MLPPPQATDPYDVPISPLKKRDTRAAGSSPRKEPVAMPEQAEDSVAKTDGSTHTESKKNTNGVRESTPQAADATPKTTPDGVENDGESAEAATAVDDSGEPDGEINGDELEIESLTSHRVDKDNATVDFLVTWASGETSWESEWSLHKQVPKLVFEYWDQYESREDATDLDIFHVFKILKRMSPSSKANQPKYLIQWVGYRRKEATWEPEDKIRLIAPDDLKAFEAKHGVAEVAGQKRRSGRGPGRPRKKARNSRDD